MNRIYQVIWSSVKDCYVVVSENAGRHGKKKAVHLAPSTTKRTMLAMSLGAAVLMGSGAAAEAAATGENATISGGVNGDASGKYSSISGGKDNVASGENSSISGGSTNTATGKNASISGGGDNEAIGEAASVSGGSQGKATGTRASVTGGLQNQAAGEFATVNGGSGNKAFGWGSSIIGGTGNVVGKMAVDENGNPKLKDSKGNDVVATIKTDDKGNTYLVDSKGNVIKDANPYTDPNSFAGSVAVAIGGMSSSVQGNYSVGIAGGSTSEAAWHGLAAGRKATVTMANGVAIGYESTASVINSSRAADKEGRIVSFGHQKGDVYYDVDYQNHTVTEHKYDSAAYNRLVNVADGIDDHDVVVMEQLKNAKAEAVATAKNQIKVKGDEVNVHAEETTDKAGVQTTTISLKPKVTLKESTDTTGAKQVVLDGTAGTISAGLSTDQQNYISLNGTTGVAKVGVVEIGNQSFTYTYDRPDGMNDNGTVKLTSTRATVEGSFVTGLSNKTWTPGNYVTGRAATEDQLEQAGRHFLSIKTAYVDKEDNPITPVAENTLANYYNDGATGSASMAFGVGTTAKGNLSLAMGVNSSASGQNSLAIGYGNEATGTKSVAVGNSSNASGNYSVAMGLGAQAGTKNTDVESTGHGGAVAVGYGAGAAETGSAAYGYSAKANAVESLAFGTSAQANKEGSIALGAHSVANREKGFTGYLAPDMTNPENAAKAETWVSTSGAVSLGGTDAAGTTISRQITNLAAGSEDSDAVNVAQLKALASQGMNFQGNDTTTSVHLDQGGTLQIQGSGRKKDEEYSTQNVKVLTGTDNKSLSIALDKNPTFDSVTAGTENGTSGGQAGSIKIVGPNSSSTNKATTITAGYAASPELAGTNGTGRISYTDGDGTAHTVATLGDGLKLAGDTGTGSVALDNTLTVSGGAKNLANGNNIGVTANGPILSLKLAKDITGLDTVTAGGVKMGTQTDGNDTTKSGNYVTGLDNKTWTVGQTQPVDGRAATENQLKSVSNTVNAGWNAKVGDQTLAVTPANNTLTFAAGDNIALTPTDSSKTITIATQPNVTFTTVCVGSTDGTDGIYIGSQPGGGANGSAISNITSITGLKNTAWVTDHFMSGRAATEDQLNEVAKTIKGEASASDIYVESGSVSYGNNGEGTGTLVRKNDKTTGQLTGLHDYYVTGGSVSTDGKTLNLTKNGGGAIPGIDMTNVLNQDSHLVAADGDGYTVGSDGKVTLQVKNNVAGSTPTNVVISGIASNAALQQGLNFKANAAEKTDGSDTYNAQLGGTVSVLGGAAIEKHTYNTDNITTTMDNGIITVKLDNDLTANSLTAGSNTVDGSVRVTGAKGAYVEMDGSDGSIHLGNNGGRYSALYQDYGGKGFLSSETSPRLEYAVDNDPNTRHTIATLDDGMKFAGDDAKTDSTNVVSRTLNSTLNITGGAATGNLTNSNIGVVKNDAGDGLTIKLNKDLTDMGTISFAPTAGTTGSGIKIGSQTIANNGASPNSATGDYITGLTNTKWSKDGIVSGRAATEDQLQQVAKSIVNGSATGGGFGLSADKADSTNATEVKQDLGSSIKITTGGDTNLSTQADSANKAIVVSLNKELNLTKTTLTDGTTRATTVVDGNGVVITPKQGSDADKVKLTTEGLSNGGKQITNVQSGLAGMTLENAAGDVLNHAANIGDLQTVSNGVKTELTNKGLNFKGNDATTTVHRNLGDTLTIQGTGADGRDYDGGANVQVKADKNANTLTVQLDRDLNAHTLTLGKETKGAEKGEEGSLILNGVNKDNGYSPVSIKAAYKTTEQDTDTSLKTNMSRLTYAVANEGTHTVATLEDGLQLAGDNGETLNTTLDKKVTIKGGVAKDKLVDNTTDPTKNNNIGVVASQDKDGNTTLSLQLAKDIAGLNTVTAGTVVMGYQTVISDQKKSETGSFVTGLGNTTWDGKDYVSGRAATEDQLKRVSDSIQNSVNNAQFGITADGLAAGGDVTIKQNLGSAIRIYGDAPVTNEKNDGSGDFWDRSKANILTKVKKDHDGNDYVSVELQDHLEVGTHAGKDTDGKDVAGVDGSMQFKGASAKEVNITGDTGIALSDGDGSARTVTAALRQDKGTGYLDLAGSEGAFTSLFAKNGKKNLTSDQDSASSTRLTYTNENSNTEHQVATMDDGLVVAGDNGQVTRLLNSTLKLSGGETDETKLSSGQNIGVVANKDKDGLDIKLAKDLTGIDSITGLKNTTIGSDFATQGRAATEEQLKLMQSSITSSITQSAQGGGFALTSDEKGDDKIVKQDLGKAIQIKGDTTYKADGSVEKEGNIKTSIDNGAIKVGLNKDVDLGDDGSIKAGGVTISNKGINAGNKNITNLASGIVNRDDRDNTNAANIGDVKTLAGEAAKTEIGKLGSRDFAGDDEKTVSRGLGESMKLSGGADASKLTGGNIGVVKNAAGDGLDIKMSKELKGLTSVTTGNSTLNNDGLTIKDGEGKAGTTITNSGIKIAANGDNTHAVEVTSSNVSMGGQQIHDVADGQSDGDAVNVSQLKKSVGALGGAIDKVDRRVDRVGAGAAALAALHPQDFDPDDKWDFAVGYGNYRGANAAAVGAFYRPNEDTTFSVGGTVGGGENMVNAGVSFKFGQGNHVSNSRVAMAKEIKDLRKEVESLRSALVDVAAGKQLDPAKTKLFPDMPKNHWAYKEISELAGNGLLDGYPDGEFKGDRMMTRYEFAQIVYNQMMAGRELSDRLVQEFEPELEHIRIDVIARHKDGTPSIERVRVNKPADKNSK